MQGLPEELVNKVLWGRIDLRTVVEQNTEIRGQFLKNQLVRSIRIVPPKSADIEFANVEDMRPRREIELDNGGLIVGSSDKSNLRIEILFGDSTARIDVEPVIRVG